MAVLGYLKPEIPTVVTETPSGEGWVHEIKHDSYRILIVVEQAMSEPSLGMGGTGPVLIAGWSRRAPRRRTPLIERRAAQGGEDLEPKFFLVASISSTRDP
jgi:hypothetical protein